MICNKCGHDAAEGSRFCPACGHTFSGRVIAIKIFKAIIALVFFAVLLGLTALTKLIFSFIDKKNKKADNDTIIINDMEENL